MLNIGESAPDFETTDHHGHRWLLRDKVLQGPVVLFFYPRDFTPVCTREACGFQSDLVDAAFANAQVAGVSADSPESHRRFAESHNLTYPLLSDPDRSIAKSYKALYLGRLPKRVTYVINQQGRIAAAIHSEFQAHKHVQQVRDALQAV